VHGHGLHHLRESHRPRLRRRAGTRGQGAAVLADADRHVPHRRRAVDRDGARQQLSVRARAGHGAERRGGLRAAGRPRAHVPAGVFLFGFVLTAWLMARRTRGALLLGILITTVLAIALNGALAGFKGFPTPGAATLPRALVQAPDFSTFGRLDFGVLARLGVVTAVLVTFSIMLSDFFDTMGTIIGVGGKDRKSTRLN